VEPGHQTVCFCFNLNLIVEELLKLAQIRQIATIRYMILGHHSKNDDKLITSNSFGLLLMSDQAVLPGTIRIFA
jgi:hypothetical protein